MFFLDRLLDTSFPSPSNLEEEARGFESFARKISAPEDPSLKERLAAIQNHPAGKKLLSAIFGNSPYLSRLLLQETTLLANVCEHGPDTSWDKLMHTLDALPFAVKEEVLMHNLRRFKAQVALLVALADIASAWPVRTVTGKLTRFAEMALQKAIHHLLLGLHTKQGLPLLDPENPSEESGLVVLGMGKLGARELNYSSDIDLIILYESHRYPDLPRGQLQKMFVSLARDLVKLMQERTGDGYVFRTDLRLRPDPASTPIALSVAGAMTYYETVGQNWERAAFIKARAVAGDFKAGEHFLKQLSPFIWRKHLDFAAIDDIRSVKRQIDASQLHDIALPGYDLKRGKGGIREIEFFAQTQQLIWGGREPKLRSQVTIETLYSLAEWGKIAADTAIKLEESYLLLRHLEHRLQMLRDEQTHALPEQEAEMERLAIFSGYSSVTAFSEHLLEHIQRVHLLYGQLFAESKPLASQGNLVFTGVDNDPATLATLAQMGFRQPADIAGRIRGWHAGDRRATRTKRARELITELMPDLLKALAATADADGAFMKFDEFLGKLPAGVQLFSLFAANPSLLELIATIMGSAPQMAEQLSRRPLLLDFVLSKAFFRPLADLERIQMAFAHRATEQSEGLEETIRNITRIRNEFLFQSGIQILKRQITPDSVAGFISNVAEAALLELLDVIHQDFISTYGEIKDSQFSIVAVGKLGSREMSFGSDLDLIFIYHMKDEDTASDSEKSLTPSVYYTKLIQRFTRALTMLNPEGNLYQVDMRLRPMGQDGPLASSFPAFEKYLKESAWTFESMALTRARVLGRITPLRANIERAINDHLTLVRDKEKLRADIHSLRQKMLAVKQADNPWRIKHVRGGLVDLEFLVQYYELASGTHAAGTEDALRLLSERGALQPDVASGLLEAHRFLSAVRTMLRLCTHGRLVEDSAPEGFKRLLAASCGEPDFARLKARLLDTQQWAHEQFRQVIET